MPRVAFPPKAPNEVQTYSFDFTSRLAASETISTKVVTASVYSGTDASPESIIYGAASSSGAIVSQKIGAGVLGVTYLLVCSITTSTGQVLQLGAYLVIAPETV